LRRPFLAEAGPLRPLLERRTETGTTVPGFARELLERTSDKSPADTTARHRLVDPLTQRPGSFTSCDRHHHHSPAFILAARRWSGTGGRGRTDRRVT
jgi:hypothetical protein